MVTLPIEAADDYGYVQDLMAAGMDLACPLSPGPRALWLRPTL